MIKATRTNSDKLVAFNSRNCESTIDIEITEEFIEGVEFSARTLKKLAEAMNVSMDDLITDDRSA